MWYNCFIVVFDGQSMKQKTLQDKAYKKISLVGNPQSGKTSLLAALQETSSATPIHIPQLDSGTESAVNIVIFSMPQQNLSIQFFDLSGKKEFDKVIDQSTYFKRDIVYICLDLSLSEVEIAAQARYWQKKAMGWSVKPYQCVLVGTKLDKISPQAVNSKKSHLTALAKTLGCYPDVCMTDAKQIAQTVQAANNEEFLMDFLQPAFVEKCLSLYDFNTRGILSNGWKMIHQRVVDDPYIMALEPQFFIHGKEYKTQLQIQAILKSREPNGELLEISDAKQDILDELDARIVDIQSSFGMVQVRSSQKSAALIDLYEQIYFSKDDKIYHVIDQWLRNPNNQRQAQQVRNRFFHSGPTQTEMMLDNISCLADPLKDTVSSDHIMV